MSASVDLILIGTTDRVVQWRLGDAVSVAPTPTAIAELIASRAGSSEAVAWLFWDPQLGRPRPERVQQAMSRPGDVWHAGLKLGTMGLPGIINFVAPTWMLNRDPDPSLEATSWRLSLRACLIGIEVLRQMGGPRPEFQTLEAAALEMGHRYITRGVLTRHVPWLIDEKITAPASVIPLADELCFAYYRFGKFWAKWAAGRAVLDGYAGLPGTFRAWLDACNRPCPAQPRPFSHNTSGPPRLPGDTRVTVLIPTLNRYPYLRVLLDQLRKQTIRPFEIIIIDQTPAAERRRELYDDFPDLPLRVIYQDEAGQCLSRNAGLQKASGDYVLFVDDDDEVLPNLIEAHLGNLHHFRSTVSSGVAQEVGAGALPENFTYFRASDVFPTNNSLICRNVLSSAGLFDLAYNRGDRADGDLGMRIYLSGALMVLRPEISVLHHHAPSGGLRTHKARVVTYAASRNSLSKRQLPSRTEIYLAMRYFTARQVREMLWLTAFGTLSIRGGRWRKAAKFLMGLVRLPMSVRQIRETHRKAGLLMSAFPQIPTLARVEADGEGRR